MTVPMVQPDLLLWQDAHFFLFQLRQFAACGRICEDQPFGDCLIQTVAQQRVYAANNTRAETFVFWLGEAFALDTAVLLKVVIEALNLKRSQLVQRDVAKSGNDVIVDVVFVVFPGVWADARLGVDPVPCPQPRCDRVVSHL